MADDDRKRAEEEAEKARLEALFKELYRYLPAVKAYLRRWGFPPERVEELAQDVFVRVYEHMKTYRGGSRLSFVTSVAHTIASNENRKLHTGKREGDMVSSDSVSDIASHDPPPDKIAIWNERSSKLYDAVNKLSDGHRIITMHFLAGESYEEMSANLGISISAVKSRLRAARQKLRELLGGPDGLGVSDG